MIKKFLMLILLMPALVFGASFVEGKDYQLITNPNPSNSKTPVVIEFFSYGCPSCYHLESALMSWVNKFGKTLSFERVPVVFKPSWELYAKAYYTANMLAMSDKMTPILFKTIQEDKNNLESAQAMIDLFVAHGLDKEIAKSAFENSPSLDLRVKEGNKLMAQYQISSVPAFVVNNKYKTDVQMAGGPDRLFQVLDYLVKK